MIDRFAERLSEYLDGELDRVECKELERHLEACASCRDDLDGLREVVARLDGAQEGRPSIDLWPQLHRSIRDEARRGRPARLALPERWLPAAAVLMAAMFLWIWWINAGPGREPWGRMDDVPRAGVIAGRAAVAPYRQAVEEWRRAVNLAGLPAPVSSSLREDLALYDQAVAEGLAILDENPDDVEWTAYVIELLQAQARLLIRAQEATEMLS